MFRNLFGKSKKQKEAEILVEENKKLQKGHLEAAQKTAKQGDKYLAIASETVEISKLLDAKSGQLVEQNNQLLMLIAQNDAVKKSLAEREVVLREKEDDLGERGKEIRRQEIYLEARKAEARRQDADIKRRDEGLESERTDIRQREGDAKKLAEASEKARKSYESRKQKLDEQEGQLKDLEGRLSSESRDFEKRKEEAQSILKKAETADVELAEKERDFEKKRAEIERSLTEKIEEYNRKLADLETAGNTVASVQFDKSEEGKSAKIVVQEAIRQAKKTLEEGAEHFSKLLDKYGKGSHAGFATPISEIDKGLKTLRSHRNTIKEHAEAHRHLGLTEISDVIDSYLTDADRCRKSWELSEAFRHICHGLATCQNYELLLKILNEFFEESDEASSASSEEADEPDYYQILGVAEDASKKDIHAAYRRKAKEWHPDRNPDGVEKMKEINQAKEVLLDEEKRKAYNERRKQKRQ